MIGVTVHLTGCDDETVFKTVVTKEELGTLLDIQRMSEEKSEYGCQPVLSVEVHQ